MERQYQLRQTRDSVKNFIHDFRKENNFNESEGYRNLNEFDIQIQKTGVLPLPRLEKILDEDIQLGYFYYSKERNGNNLNFTIEKAREIAKENKLNNNAFIEKNSIVKNEKAIKNSLMDRLLKATSQFQKLQCLEELDQFSKKTYIEILEIPIDSPDPEIQDWFEENFDKKTLESLQNKSIVKSANQNPKSYPVPNIQSYPVPINENSSLEQPEPGTSKPLIQQPSSAPINPSLQQPAPWPINPRQQKLAEEEDSK